MDYLVCMYHLLAYSHYSNHNIWVSYKLQVYSSSQICHTATGTHMPYGITQCYLPPDRGDTPAGYVQSTIYKQVRTLTAIDHPQSPCITVRMFLAAMEETYNINFILSVFVGEKQTTPAKVASNSSSVRTSMSSVCERQ